MHILLYVDVLEEYFATRGAFHKSEEDLLRLILVEKRENLFLLSGAYETCLYKYFEAGGIYHDDYTTFVTELIDQEIRYTLVATDKTVVDIEKAFCDVYLASSLGEILIPLSEVEQPRFSSVMECGVISMMAVPNWHWMLVHLAAYHSCQIRHSDNLSGASIRLFFHCAFNVPRVLSDVVVIERYCNVQKHKYLGRAIRRGAIIKYHVLSTGKINTNLTLLKKRLIKHTSALAQLLSTSKSHVIHERAILFSSLVIESDQDFAELTPVNQAWRVDLYYNPNHYAAALKKCASEFTLVP